MKNRITVTLTSFLVMFLFAVPNGQAQPFSVQTVIDWTAQQLVDSMLKGQGVEITNAKFNRASVIQGNNIGIFHNLNLYSPIDRLQRPASAYSSGIIMTTGAISKATSSSSEIAATPSNIVTENGSLLADPNLIGIGTATANNIRSLTLLEFDFISNSAYVQFNYIFASAEYPEYVYSVLNVNDVFAFHISGIDPATLAPMNRNIALLPNSVIGVTINNVNNGNSYSGGSATTVGANAANPEYFFDNRSNAYTNSIKYGGFTVDLVASAIILSCFYEPYHMSLSISDISDNQFHSAIFLQKGSFKSPEVQISQTSELGNNDTIMTGCNPSFINLTLPQPNTRPVRSLIHALDATDGATALRGTHYNIIDLSDGRVLPVASLVNFNPATVVYNETTYRYEFLDGDTLKRLKIEAIPGAIPPGEIRIAKIYTALSLGGGALAEMCEPPVATDTLTFILKGYTLLELGEDTAFNRCNQFEGSIGMDVKNGFLQSVIWEGSVENLNFISADSLTATTIAPITDTTVFKVIGVDKYGCSRDTAEIRINIPKRPEAAIQTNVTAGCTPFKFNPSSVSAFDAYLRWVASEGQTSALKNPTFTINTDTTVWLYAYAADYCYDSTFVHVNVFERPDAQFDYLPFEPQNGRPIEFFNTSTGDISDYRWNFGDGTTSTEANPIHTYHVGSSETFNVQLIAVAGAIENCADTILQQILVEDHYAYYVPTGFTPNGDGVNDVFAPALTDVFDYTLAVYNRWGSLVFFSNEIGSGWDGKDKNGKTCDAGIYVWKINFKKYVDPKVLLEYKGMVTLTR
jgi:gliding motility-associated-like protein